VVRVGHAASISPEELLGGLAVAAVISRTSTPPPVPQRSRARDSV
jgi:hypothetical protein